MAKVIVCTPRSLPREVQVAAASRAIRVNPANRPPAHAVMRALGTGPLQPDEKRVRIALVVGRRWPASGVRLGVGFLDDPPKDLRKRVLLHMNAWGKSANVKFREARTDPEVRIARLDHPEDMAGYWSYLGTEILEIPGDQPTLNLEGFTMKTPESEFHRVVRHEAGHTLGFPHEHMRRELVEKIDRRKAVRYFRLTQGWTADEVREQVLTPIEESTLLGTEHTDADSIMCYQIPGSITKDGKPIRGGRDIDAQDYAFAKAIYPKKRK